MVVATSTADTREHWIPALSTWGQAVLLLLIAIGVYFQTWIDIWPYWENKNATYTHGTLVALVAIWLVWRTRKTVNKIAPTPSALALPVVLLLSAIWLLAEKANIFIVYSALWPLLGLAAIWAGLGPQAAYRFVLPLSFLYFAIPIWDYLKPLLQAITATMTGFLTGLFGIPAALEGSYVTLPTATIFIAEDCSGAHFLCVALAVGVLAGVMRKDVLRTRILILLVAGVLSMAFNWLRVLLIVLAYLHPGLREAFETVGHITFGWWVFALDLLVFALVLRFVPRSASESANRQPQGSTTTQRNSGVGLVAVIMASVILPAAAWALPLFDSYPEEVSNADLGLFSAQIELTSPDLRWSPRYPGPAREDRFAVVTDTGIAIEVYRNRFHEQNQGSELISRGSHLFDPSRFFPNSSDIVILLDSQGHSIPVRSEVLHDSEGVEWLSYHTYLVDNEPIASSRRVQLATALRSIHSRTTAGVVAAAIPCTTDCEFQISELKNAFIRALEDFRREFNE